MAHHTDIEYEKRRAELQNKLIDKWHNAYMQAWDKLACFTKGGQLISLVDETERRAVANEILAADAEYQQLRKEWQTKYNKLPRVKRHG